MVLVGATRGAGTLLQATLVADRWGSARYGALAGIFAAPITVATALAPWAATALADLLGGSYPGPVRRAGRLGRGHRHRRPVSPIPTAAHAEILTDDRSTVG